MITKVHYYSFDLNKADHLKQYDELIKSMKSARRLIHRETLDRVILNLFFELSRLIELPLITTKVFNDKWRTIHGIVFDWFEVIHTNAHREGYYLDITDEMQSIRDETYQCTNCGHQWTNPYPYFCRQCIDHVDHEQLYTLFLRPVSMLDTPVNPKNIILPPWVIAQWETSHVVRATIQ